MGRFRQYIAGLGISGSLLGAIVVSFLILGGTVAFDSWPEGPEPGEEQAVLVSGGGAAGGAGVPAPASPAELAVVPPITVAPAIAPPVTVSPGPGGTDDDADGPAAPGAPVVPATPGDPLEPGGPSGGGPGGGGPDGGGPDDDEPPPPSGGLGKLLADLVRPVTDILPETVGRPVQDTVDGAGQLVDDLTGAR